MQDIFSSLVQAPVDPIFGISQAYKADTHPSKIDLGVGAYRTDEEKPYVFQIVKQVEASIFNDNTLNKEYLPIDGIPQFNQLSQKLMFGVVQDRIVTVQALGGTGALRLGFDFIYNHIPIPGEVYVTKPTWSNHLSIIQRAGLKVREYQYFNPETNGFHLKETLATLNQAQPNSVVLLHVCAHNPTGVDPTEDEWKQIAEVCKSNSLIPFFDCAYQGFASGDIEKDVFAVRYFTELGFQMLVAQSYSKNMGLYNDRVGALHIVSSNKEIANKVLSQIKIVIRTAYSNPPCFGARIASRILGNEENYNAWVQELKQITGRIEEMRVLLKKELDELKVPGDWSHILRQRGFFTFTGLNAGQCEKMSQEHHVYMLKNGRISMAGITTKNVQSLAKAIQAVIGN